MNFEITLDEALSRCVKDERLHVRLLNTFSLMENIGAQKIHRFQRFGFRSEFILQHAAEEARHALFFKKQANRLGGTLEDDHALASRSSRQYLRQIEISVIRYVKSVLKLQGQKQHFVTYLLTTLLIELRANEIYPRYERVLVEARAPLTLRSILAEERRHLDEIRDRLASELGSDVEGVMAALMTVEFKIYQIWFKELLKDIV